VLRLADAAGSQRVIFITNADPNWPRKRLERTARNAAATVAWAFCSTEEFLPQLDSLPPLIAVETTAQSTSLYETTLPNPCTLVVGNERYGIPDSLLTLCQSTVRIPMYGVNTSMNVTHALAIALFEWRRQHPNLQPPTF
jgi:tRNA G18 (ribose-2'-O)-methylase SpoU